MTGEKAERALAALFWVALPFTLVMALLPHPPTLPGEAGDKLLHVLAFSTLSLLASAGFSGRRRLQVLLGLVVLGGAIELLQAIPSLHRDAEWLDWLADCAAVLVTFTAYQAAVSAWQYWRR